MILNLNHILVQIPSFILKFVIISWTLATDLGHKNHLFAFLMQSSNRREALNKYLA